MNSMGKLLGAGVLGLAIGGTLSWGNMYARLQPALHDAAQAKSARDEAVKAGKALEGKLKDAEQSIAKLQSASKAAEQATKAAEQAAKEARDQLAGALSGKEAAEKALGEAKTQLAAAVSAKEAAERALAEAKKSATTQ